MKKWAAMDFNIGSLAAIAHANNAFYRNLLSASFTAFARTFMQGTKYRARFRPNTGLAAFFVDANVNAFFVGHIFNSGQMAAAANAALFKLMPQRLHNVFGHFFGIIKQHHGVITEKQFVIDACITRRH